MRPLYEEGRLQKGATLIVKSFDRLSCAEPIDALGIFTDVIQSALNLAILNEPPKVFNHASIKANRCQLFEAYSRHAHEESKRKGDLVGGEWIERKQRAARGQLHEGAAIHRRALPQRRRRADRSGRTLRDNP